MREISVNEITQAVRELCIKSNQELPASLEQRLADATDTESDPLAKKILGQLQANLDAARSISVPICQDTGMAVVFVTLGQEVHIVGGGLNDSINEGVRQGYLDGLLRLSVVADPLRRENTNDNTPAIIHTTVTEGDTLTITVAPKGFGSENMSKLSMLTPAATKEQIVDYVVSVVCSAGGNPCPPTVVGVGIGGDFEYVAYLAKKALCRGVELRKPDPYYAEMEQEILHKINQLGIGPQGFGGDTSAFAVNIETFPTHIAGLPVAVNIGCHVTRHATVTL